MMTRHDDRQCDTALRTIVRHHERPARLIVLGGVDSVNAARFNDVLHAAVTRDPLRRLIVDISNVTSFSSAAVGVLDEHRDHLTAVLVSRRSPGNLALEGSLTRSRRVFCSPTAVGAFSAQISGASRPGKKAQR